MIPSKRAAHNFLVAPLNWGLGHASRCMPIINELLARGKKVIIASDGRTLSLLKAEYPQLLHIELQGYQIEYGEGNWGFILKMAKQVPYIFRQIYREYQQVQQIIRQYQIDCVISDNRFGCWSGDKKVYSIFMTHQLFIKMPPTMRFAEPLLWQLNQFFIKKYDECWIPDFPDKHHNLSGSLSHCTATLPNITQWKYIGALSRFRKDIATNPQNAYDVLMVLSGPEPQRTHFEKLLIQQVEQLPNHFRCLLVRGITEEQHRSQSTQQLTIINYLTASELNQAMLTARYIVARTGYSTIMDLATLGKKAILVPTPHQTEQEYLARHFKEKKIFYTILQKNFNLIEALKNSKQYTGLNIKMSNNQLLVQKIDSLL